jgi:hypothetical protein
MSAVAAPAIPAAPKPSPRVTLTWEFTGAPPGTRTPNSRIKSGPLGCSGCSACTDSTRKRCNRTAAWRCSTTGRLTVQLPVYCAAAARP